MDRSSKHKISKDTMALNDRLDQMDLADTFRTFHPKAEEYTFFLSAPGTFSRIDHILGLKSALNMCQKDRAHTIHTFRPQGYETCNQPQEKSWTALRKREAKVYPTKE